MCVCLSGVCAEACCTLSGGEGIRSPGAGVTGIYEPPDLKWCQKWSSEEQNILFNFWPTSLGLKKIFYLILGCLHRCWRLWKPWDWGCNSLDTVPEQPPALHKRHLALHGEVRNLRLSLATYNLGQPGLNETPSQKIKINQDSGLYFVARSLSWVLI